MAYKSNKQARAEYVANENKNRGRNRGAYERRKERASSGGGLGKAILLIVALVLIVQYMNQRRSTPQKAVMVSQPVHARY